MGASCRLSPGLALPFFSDSASCLVGSGDACAAALTNEVIDGVFFAAAVVVGSGGGGAVECDDSD